MVRPSGLSVWARVISAWRVPAAIVGATILLDLGVGFACAALGSALVVYLIHGRWRSNQLKRQVSDRVPRMVANSQL